jgi:hypothetical protein
VNCEAALLCKYSGICFGSHHGAYLVGHKL